jgi:hypothetical protein
MFMYAGGSILLCVTGCLSRGDDTASIEQATFRGTLDSRLPTGAYDSTTATSDQNQPTCVSITGGGDMSYSWTPSAPGIYRFSTVDPLTELDSILQIRDFETGAPLGCSDDVFPGFQSSVDVALPVVRAVRVIVDSYPGHSGWFYLHITDVTPAPPPPPPPPPPACVCGATRFSEIRTGQASNCAAAVTMARDAVALAVQQSCESGACNIVEAPTECSPVSSNRSDGFQGSVFQRFSCYGPRGCR